jgi:hypothetical protein
MRKVHVLLLSAFLLGAVVLPVFDSTVGSGRFQAQPVQAQGQVAAEIAIGCLSTTVGQVVCTGIVITALALWVQMGGDIPSGDELTNVIDGLVGWINGGGPGVDQYVQQYANHPNYIWLTLDMLTEMGNALSGLATWGFTYGTDWGGTGHPYWGRTWGTSTVVMKTDYLTLPVGANCQLVKEQGDSHQLLGGGGAVKNVKVEFQLEADQSLHDATTWGIGGSNYSASPNVGVWDESEGSGCNLSGAYGRFVMTIPKYNDTSDPTGMVGYPYAVSPTVIHAHWWVDGEDPSVSVNMTDFAIAGADISEILAYEGERYNTPLNGLFLDTWDGAADVPLSTGLTGALIGATAIPVPDDTSWWEGLFGGLGGKLTGIGKVLQDIWDAIKAIGETVADVATDVKAIPQTVVDAFTTAMVPNTAELESDWGDTADLMGSRAPFSWLLAIYSVLPNLFTGGSSCVQMDMGAESVGWPPVVLNMCIPEGAATVTKAISRVVAVMLMLFYTVNTARQVMNWGRD